MVASQNIRRALTAADLEAAHAAAQPAIVGDVEGLDFLEGKLERLEQSHQRGVRQVQLVHYTPNDIGDFQTGIVTHHGLTSYGAEVIRACLRCSRPVPRTLDNSKTHPNGAFFAESLLPVIPTRGKPIGGSMQV